mgnify:CR=1 FL=1
MKKRSWYRDWAETGVVLICLGWVPLLPRRAVLGLGQIISRIGVAKSSKLWRIGRANLDLAFGEDKSPVEKDAILRKCFENHAIVVLDFIWFSFRSRARQERWIKWHPSADVLFKDQAACFLTAHYGNWEVLGQSLAARGVPLYSVAADLKNASAGRIMNHLRECTGQVIIPQQGAARKMLRALREGKKLAVLLDQNPRPRQGGVFINFFGLPVPVSPAAAALAVKTRAPVCTLVAVPDERGVYTVTVHDVLSADPTANAPVTELAQRMADSVVSVIRAAPEHWCWMYKRWKFVPSDRTREDYPFYARVSQPGDFKDGDA